MRIFPSRVGIKHTKWSLEEKQIVLDNYGKLSEDALLVMLPNRTAPALRMYAERIGIRNKQRLYTHNENFFSIPNLINSYWAGFLAADGYVYNKGSTLSVQLQERDKEHLDRFVADIEFTGKFNFRYTQSPTYKDRFGLQCGVRINSAKTLLFDLERNFSITQNKTFTIKPPNIEDRDLIRAFITGLIDGDGSVVVYNADGRYINDRLYIGVLGSEFLINWVESYFVSVAPSERKTYKGVTDRGNVKQVKVMGKRAVLLAKDLALVNVPRMRRKWEKVKGFI